jgi:membrane dipeptidase
MLGNSLSTLRIFAQLGTRYLTLTHTCHNVFASSAGFGPPLKQRHEGNGLSDLGRELVYELNRLGILVDLSHVSDETMEQAITLSRAPIVFTHSGARSVHPHVRNVPDKVIKRIGLGAGQQDGVMYVFSRCHALHGSLMLQSFSLLPSIHRGR